MKQVRGGGIYVLNETSACDCDIEMGKTINWVLF
jgi:hypothetical protein